MGLSNRNPSPGRLPRVSKKIVGLSILMVMTITGGAAAPWRKAAFEVERPVGLAIEIELRLE